MNLRIFDNVDDLAHGAAETILQRLRGRARAAIALSGGSTPKPLYDLLGGPRYRDELAKMRVIWVVVDERYVPLDDPQSNAAMMQRTLFRDGMSPGHEFLRFRTELNDPAATAREFESEWHRHSLDNLDIVVLGVGDDGHTASLFPATSVLDVTGRIAAEVFVPGLNQWRVTITMPVVRAAGWRMVLAAGKSKQPVIDDVRRGVDHPITRATSGEIESWWFADRAAAEPANDSLARGI